MWSCSPVPAFASGLSGACRESRNGAGRNPSPSPFHRFRTHCRPRASPASARAAKPGTESRITSPSPAIARRPPSSFLWLQRHAARAEGALSFSLSLSPRHEGACRNGRKSMTQPNIAALASRSRPRAASRFSAISRHAASGHGCDDRGMEKGRAPSARYPRPRRSSIGNRPRKPNSNRRCMETSSTLSRQ